MSEEQVQPLSDGEHRLNIPGKPGLSPCGMHEFVQQLPSILAAVVFLSRRRRLAIVTLKCRLSKSSIHNGWLFLPSDQRRLLRAEGRTENLGAPSMVPESREGAQSA